MEETKELKLKRPITIGEHTYDSLTLREPTAGQIEKSANGANAAAGNIILIAEVAKVPIAVVRQMSHTDYNEACAVLSGFTEPSPPTGGN